MRIVAAARVLAALSGTALLAAHVGSPDIYYTGTAGPYVVEVVVRPPMVVPGIASVLVRVRHPAISRVVVRPVYWRAGSKGAPSGDDARRVHGSADTYAGDLWLMASGSYSVHVTVSGAAGEGTVVIPVPAVATGQLALGPAMTGLLGVLGILLLAGLFTVVHAAAGESQQPPGETLSPQRRRRARRAVIVSVPIVLFIVAGGARWWRAEADRYRRTLYKPVPTRALVQDSAGVPTLVLTVTDSAWRSGRVTPVMPDHGKLAHLFLARADSLDVFAHLHPVMPDRSTFVTRLPPLPAGRYRVFMDVVHESGFERTLVDSFTIASPLSDAARKALDPDDAWFAGPPVAVRGQPGVVALGDGITIRWAGTPHPSVGEPGALHFALADSASGAVRVDPYLGMHGHAVVMRRDGRVFIHLHPSGTASMASQLAFVLRDRGDTSASGRLRLDSAPTTMVSSAPLREIAFPYAFPSAGVFRVWVQLRARTRVRTASFDVTVSDMAARR